MLNEKYLFIKLVYIRTTFFKIKFIKTHLSISFLHTYDFFFFFFVKENYKKNNEILDEN